MTHHTGAKVTPENVQEIVRRPYCNVTGTKFIFFDCSSGSALCSKCGAKEATQLVEEGKDLWIDGEDLYEYDGTPDLYCDNCNCALGVDYSE